MLRRSARGLAAGALFAAGAGLVTALDAAPLRAQAQASTGLIRGTVTDSSGRPLAEATVTLRNLETNATRTLRTNERGAFAASLLRVGTYDVSIRQVGYREVTRRGLQLRLGESTDLNVALDRTVVTLSTTTVTGAPTTGVDASKVESSTRLDDAVVAGLPNNGRNFLNLTLLTPNVAITQGPDGDELSIGGQRGIHNNVSVDGADFNNPFFGEQRGGQRPAFTFNLDAVQEIVVVSQGANAEFGRSGGGFVNVITKSGTNSLKGSAHYYGKNGSISANLGDGSKPDFRQNQFGFTLGGPIMRDRAFFFVAYDQQVFDQTKQDNPNRIEPRLRSFLDTAFAGALRNDYGPINRTNDANALLVKTDVRLNENHNASLKYNYTNARQENGTFDVDVWGRSANGIERSFSHAVNGALTSVLSSALSNEFRFQVAREDRPRPYGGPVNPATGRRFPDTGIGFAEGYRFGQPFFLPIDAYDTRFQILDNVSLVRGNHLFKVGGEYNRTEAKQTFVGFANGRMIFGSVDGFLNYVQQGPTYVECSDGSSNTTGGCPSGTTITGPVALYLQNVGLGGRTPEQAGTQAIAQQEFALFAQDSWKATQKLTLNYGLRWEAQQQPDPITPPSEVFFADFIGTTVTNSTGTYEFASDGTIPSDKSMFQPRFGFAYDISGDASQVVRGSAGLYYARVPGLVLASARSTNGSISQSLFRNSGLTGVLGAPPAYGELLPTPAGQPFRPDVFVFDKDFRNPRTFSGSFAYERALFAGLVGTMTYTHARTDFLTRFVDRNAAVFGNPFSTGLGADRSNGLNTLTVVESSAKSRYNGITFEVAKRGTDRLQYQVNYTLSADRSDDDNERDPFSFRYARANRLDREYGYSDRDQRHRLNAWLLARAPGKIYFNNRISAYSAQPASESCGANNTGTGDRAGNAENRVCRDVAGAETGVIIQRNTIRKDNGYFSWDVRISRPFETGRGAVEAIVEVFNVTNADNFRDPGSGSLLFNFDGTVRQGFGEPRQVQAGIRYVF